MQVRTRVNFSFFVFSVCFHFNDIHATLLYELKSVDENILKLSRNKLIKGIPNLALIRTLDN